MDDMSTFRVTYDGPALEDSQMDVRDLAPALLAVGDLLEAATAALYGDKVKPQVDVRGSFSYLAFDPPPHKPPTEAVFLRLAFAVCRGFPLPAIFSLLDLIVFLA